MADKHGIENVVFSGHAVRQMFDRNISVDDIKNVIGNGEIIASYPEDVPYQSELLLGYPSSQPLHVVLAYNEIDKTGYVITAYIPDQKLWTNDFKKRKKT